MQAVTDLHVYTKFAAGVVSGDIEGVAELSTRNGVCSQEMADAGKCTYQGCGSHDVAPSCGYNFHCLDDRLSGLASQSDVRNKQCQKKKTDVGFGSYGSAADLLQCEGLTESSQYSSKYFGGTVQFPYIQSSDRVISKSGQCNEFNRHQLMEQGQIWALEKDGNDATTGKRTTSSFGPRSYWYANADEMPGATSSTRKSSGAFKADISTSRGRLEASSIFDTVVAPLFSYIPRKDDEAGYWAMETGWDEDGLRVSHSSGMAGGTDLDQWMPTWTQNEEDAATRLPNLCQRYEDSSGTGQGAIKTVLMRAFPC
jgi:hypothetical protein